ncbi:MAG: type IV toxin-antitoxin system AbiEi family antitoxin [Chitinophagaceae bacterium]|nr:type IV toxin-antitoxin system AbiEi family antitoxin [Chitinophagaceae bacterium]
MLSILAIIVVFLPKVQKRQPYRQLEQCLDDIQGKGKFYFTLEEVKKQLQIEQSAVQKQLQPLLKKQKVALIRNGFYAIVPPEYRITGAPPVTYYIDGMMQLLKRPYYIGLLNAAAWYGAAHQQPQKYAVIVPPPVLPAIRKPYASIEFFYKKSWQQKDIVQQKTNAGYVMVSSPELTALDLCYYSRHAGGINQVATVLQELSEEIDAHKLVEVAGRYFSRMAVQRVGYLLELLGYEEKVLPLKEWLRYQKYHAALLESGDKNHKSKITGNDWRIIVNAEIESDL